MAAREPIKIEDGWVCVSLRLQRVNTQTSCQSRLRHSKQSEETRVNAIVHEFAHLFTAESS